MGECNANVTPQPASGFMAQIGRTELVAPFHTFRRFLEPQLLCSEVGDRILRYGMGRADRSMARYRQQLLADTKAQEWPGK
jgi:hypothetical protein